jgi:hypothetical protein
VTIGSALAVAFLMAVLSLRALPRIVWPDLEGTDSWYHRLYMDLIRDNGHRIPDRHPRILGPGHFTYPALFHWLLSFAPAGLVTMIDRFGGLAFDLVTGALLSSVLWAGGHVGGPEAIGLTALYMLLPGLTLFHIGPRGFSLTPRAFAQMLYAIAVIALLDGVGREPGIGVVVATLVGTVLLALVYLAAKFPLQNIVLVFPLVSAVTWNPIWIVAAMAAFPVAYLTSGGFFWTQLRGQFDHLRWYYVLNRAFISHRHNWGRILATLRSRDLRAFVMETVWHNPVLSGLVRHVVPVFGAIAVALAGGDLAASPVRDALLALTCLALVPWILTSFDPFSILGESERYLEFATPPAWLLLWTALPTTATDGVFIMIAAVAFATYIANLYVMGMANRAFGVAEARQTAGFVARYPAPVVLCLQTSETPLFVHACPDARFADLNGTLSLRGEAGTFLAWFLWRYPHVHPDRLPEIVERFEVTLIVERLSAGRRVADQFGRAYDFQSIGFSPIFHNAGYAVYGRTEPTATAD